MTNTPSLEDAQREAADLKRLMDMLPIYATRVGYRSDSTDDMRRIGEAAFAAHRAWRDAMDSAVLS